MLSHTLGAWWREYVVILVTAVSIAFCSSCATGPDDTSTAASSGDDREASTASSAEGVPQFEYDPTWPKLPLPNQWILGEVGGLSVDGRGHVWVIHRPWTVTGRELGAVDDEAQCCRPAPSVVEFDPEGNLVQAWPELQPFRASPGTAAGQGNQVGPDGALLWESAPGPYGEWGRREHTVLVDHTDHVWVSNDTSHVIYKFTRDGGHVLTIGEAGVTSGSNDTTHLGRPAGLAVDPETNELFVADGYTNRRVIVFDAATGEYRRHWGAYGNPPEDEPLGPYDPDLPPAQQSGGPCTVSSSHVMGSSMSPTVVPTAFTCSRRMVSSCSKVSSHLRLGTSGRRTAWPCRPIRSSGGSTSTTVRTTRSGSSGETRWRPRAVSAPMAGTVASSCRLTA